MKYNVYDNHQLTVLPRTKKSWLILPVVSLVLLGGLGTAASQNHSTAFAADTTSQAAVVSPSTGNLGSASYSWDDTSKTLTINAGGTMSKVEDLSFAQDIQTIRFTGAVKAPENSDHLLAELHQLTSIDGLSYLDTSDVTSMYYMFRGDAQLTALDVSHFDTSKVTDMSAMFSGLSALQSLDVSNFNTSQVTNMRYLFSNDSALHSLDLSHFNTANVTSMYAMFSMASGLHYLDISSFDTSKVLKDSMDYMFNGIGDGSQLFINMPNAHFSWWSLLGDTWKGDRYDHLYTPIDNPTDRNETGDDLSSKDFRTLYDTGSHPGGWYVWGRHLTKTETKVVKRTINYQDQSGKTIASATVQELTYQRTITKDLLKDTSKTSAWTVKTGQASQFAEVVLPETIDTKYINPKVDGQAVTKIASETPNLTEADTEDELDKTVNVNYSVNPAAPASNNNRHHRNGLNLPSTGGEDDNDQDDQDDNGQSSQSTQNSRRKHRAQLPSTGKQIEQKFGVFLPLTLGLSATLTYFFTKGRK
ncbi:BspA family leucine-rich repeat surface protein [Fructobacillus durionis]|uniref:Surface protein n=1 Tax=Fructobacillus durionis TaxID=283737 RepID=A0A1I1GR80_9LACO|nr:BspA family leucine-rich repeat surface protein [Fructobacillus durionis]SFC13996.1 surface protein [Fructobacillus durionis]